MYDTLLVLDTFSPPCIWVAGLGLWPALLTIAGYSSNADLAKRQLEFEWLEEGAVSTTES